MPNKIKVTKEDILNCALSITKKEGINNVNARNIAKNLNCSIQPIYYYFGTMDNLRNEIVKAAKNVYNSYIKDSKYNNNQKPFKAVGLAYIKFASNEPNLFNLLFMSNLNKDFGINSEIDDNYEYIISTIDAPKEEVKNIYETLWISAHGIATMIATGFMKLSPERISDILQSVYNGQVLMIEKKNEIL